MGAIITEKIQVVYRSQDHDERKLYYSGKKKAFTLKTQVVPDGEHDVDATSVAVPGTMHDKKLLERSLCG